MERKSAIRKMTLAIGASFFCFSCTPGTSSSEESSYAAPSFAVYLIPDNLNFEILSENPVSVPRGQDAKFTIHLHNNVFVESVTQSGREVPVGIETDALDVTTLTIENIRYGGRYNLVTEEGRYQIAYYPNGGEYIEEGLDSSKPFQQYYSLRHRLRPNTEIGTDRLKRDGYVLSGWNTKPDGSGERAGLGSRVTIPEEGSLNLYATWEEETPANQFSYSANSGGISISKYLGNEERVVVPSHIEGKEVTRIGGTTFTGEEKAVILPPTIATVAYGAFAESKVEELYFYDNLMNISDDSFLSCPNFSTIHINAILAPRYGGKNLYSEINLGDKYDILILNKDKKKLLVFGGSGSYISINTNTIEKALDDDTVCINMAVNGWFNGMAQFEMMLPFLKEGDTFIHSPETSSQFSLLHGLTMIPEINKFTYNKIRFLCCCESNYDLLGLVDFRHVDDLLTGFSVFNNYRINLTPTTYTDYKTTVNLYGKKYENCDLAYIDNRGNFAMAKPAKSNPGEAGEADMVVEYVTDEAAHNRLNGVYDKMRAKGVTVYFANAPLNKVTLQMRLDSPELFDTANPGKYLYYGRPDGIPYPDYPNIEVWCAAFEQAVADYLNVEVLVPTSKTFFVTDDYFEPDYHLCDEKSVEFTQLFVDALLQKRGGAS